MGTLVENSPVMIDDVVVGSVGAITEEIDLTKMIDTQFLPDDIKALK